MSATGQDYASPQLAIPGHEAVPPVSGEDSG